MLKTLNNLATGVRDYCLDNGKVALDSETAREFVTVLNGILIARGESTLAQNCYISGIGFVPRGRTSGYHGAMEVFIRNEDDSLEAMISIPGNVCSSYTPLYEVHVARAQEELRQAVTAVQVVSGDFDHHMNNYQRALAYMEKTR